MTTDQTGDMVLLSGRPGDEVQELALASRAPGPHVAFRVDSLGELLQLHVAAPKQGARVLFAFDHGSTLSLYVLDPEGNACELYWETGRPPADTNRPVDLGRPEAEVREALGL